jgi:flagellar hook-associated protein 2
MEALNNAINMPVGNITGLSSGIKWADTVASLMALERKPVDDLQTRKTTYQTQITDWNSIEGKLTSLKSSAEGIDTPTELLTKNVTSSDSDILTASASANAIIGTHDILVNRLATNHILAHTAGWADADSTPINNSGVDQKLSYDYGGVQVTVTVPDGTTLTGLVNLINQDGNNASDRDNNIAGISASILNDGLGGATPYHLVLTGNDTGANHAIQIIDTIANPTDLGTGTEFDTGTWNITQAADNAELRVDGFPDPSWGWPNPWIESSSNTVTDIIPGVTLNLQATSATHVKIQTTLDKSAAESKVKSVLDSFNGLLTTLTSLTSYDADNKVAGPLSDDPLARSLRMDLMSMIATSIPGTDNNDRFRSLGEVGVSIGSGGSLSLDTTKFEKALDTDPVSVARVFGFDSTNSSTFVSVAGHSNKTVGGIYNYTLSYDASGKLLPSGTNTIDGKNATVHGESIVEGASDGNAAGLLMLLTNPGDGPNSLSGTVKVYTGFSVLLANKIAEITDATDGSLANARKRINDSIKVLDNRITEWNDRLTRIEANYNKRFQAMEILIGQLKTQSSSLSALG